MDAWSQLVWKRTPETDAHRDRARDPYEHREADVMHAHFRDRRPRITDFVSQYAIGDNLAASSELLIRSRQLIADSKAQALRVKMRLLVCHTGKSIQ